MTNFERIVIVGGGSLAKELITWMIDSNFLNNAERKIFFIDDNYSNDIFLSEVKINYLGSIKDFYPLENDYLYLGISNPKKKRKIVELMDERNAKFNSFIHPSAIIAQTSKIGRGCIIFPYSVCSCNSNLSDFITINLHSAVGHDVSIDSFTTVSSFVDLTGKVKVGKEVLIGSGARFLPSVMIGDCSLIGAGAIIYKSVPKGKTAYSQPSKLL